MGRAEPHKTTLKSSAQHFKVWRDLSRFFEWKNERTYCTH